VIPRAGAAEVLVVEVTDMAGNAICWGGPYTAHEARDALDLFDTARAEAVAAAQTLYG